MAVFSLILQNDKLYPLQGSVVNCLIASETRFSSISSIAIHAYNALYAYYKPDFSSFIILIDMYRFLISAFYLTSKKPTNLDSYCCYSAC